jgi:hypothetical protein
VFYVTKEPSPCRTNKKQKDETMKKIFTTMLLALVCGMALQAQDADYQPLVREGVKWMNTRQFIYFGDETYYDPITTYSLQFSGDTVITSTSGTFTYKIINSVWPNVFVREDEKKVYCIDNDPYSICPDEEYLLYDFSGDSQALLCSSPYKTQMAFDYEGSIEINGKRCRVFHGPFGHLIESVGLVSTKGDGDLIDIRWERVAGGEYYWQLDHMEDLDGNVIYDPHRKDYPPLVREGIKWIYRSRQNDTDEDVFYVMELMGDTIIETLSEPYSYKKCYKYPIAKGSVANSIDLSVKTPVAYLREFDQLICCLDYRTVQTMQQTGNLTRDWLLYDFSDICQAALGGAQRYVFKVSEPTSVQGHQCRVFVDETGQVMLIESIGLVTLESGDLLGVNEYSGLSHVLDADGNIIYRGPNYRFFASDINGDGTVDISDVNEVINMMLGKSPASADITGDGKVDISDVNAVINVMLGK